MPDQRSTPDDPFAALFSQLPDPRERAHESATSTSASTAPASATPAPDPQTDSATPPLSRRAAREAAERAGHTGEQPIAPSTPHPAAAAPAAPVAPAPAAAASAAAAPPRSTPAPDVAAPAAVVPAQTSAQAASRPATMRGTYVALDEPDQRPAERTRTATVAAPASPTLDDLFADSARDEAAHGGGRKKKRRVGGWIALAVVVILVGGVAGTGVWVWNTYQDKIRSIMGWEEPKDYEDGLAHGEALVTISDGDIPSTISKSLYGAGVTKTSGAFYDMLIKTQQNPTFYPGVYKLQKQMSATAALDALKNPANKLEHSALLREGLTLDQSITILSESLDIPLADFEAAVKKPSDYGVKADSLEGWMFPAMYTFDPGVTAKQVVQQLVDQSVKALDAAGVPEADREKILIVASIIQREARFEDDFYKVSRVIYNRLEPGNQETFGYLQMDSTAQYGYGELHDGTVSSSEAALKDDNPWNTYVHTGLPIGPISNPGAKAIDAAMHPADGDWLYFVTVNLDTGETVFTKTLAEHNKAVAKFQSWCKANPDSGC